MPESPQLQPVTLDDKAFYGHPRGLGWIVAAEVGWAFAYYGLVSILTLYMSRQLFTAGHIDNIWGFAGYSAAMQSAFGKMSPLELASQTFGLITGLIYATPILGGLAADRWLGHKRAVTIGFSVAAVAFALLTTEQGFLIAAVLLVVAAGLIKSNLLGQIGRLYGDTDPRRTRAFGIFLIAVNIGGFLSPVIVGTLGEKVGWRVGLVAVAIGAAFALAAYVLGLRHMPNDLVRTEPDEGAKGPALSRAQLTVVAALGAVLLVSVLNAGTYNQAFNIFPVWATDHVDRNLFGFEMPVTWFSTLDGILTIVATALAVRFWAWQSARGQEPRETSRIAVGSLMMTGAFLMLTVGALIGASGVKTPIVMPLLFFVLADGALPWIDTVMMALISRTAPPNFVTTMLGIYYLTYAAGNFLVGTLGRLYEHMTPVAFWGVHAAIAGAAAVYILVVGGWLNGLMGARGPTQAEPQPAGA